MPHLAPASQSLALAPQGMVWPQRLEIFKVRTHYSLNQTIESGHEPTSSIDWFKGAINTAARPASKVNLQFRSFWIEHPKHCFKTSVIQGLEMMSAFVYNAV